MENNDDKEQPTSSGSAGDVAAQNRGDNLADVMTILSRAEARPVIEALRVDLQTIIIVSEEILRLRREYSLQDIDLAAHIRKSVMDEITAVAAKDPTLVRLLFQYRALIKVVQPPESKGGYQELEKKKQARQLANAYLRGRERQYKLRMELIPENKDFIRRISGAATTRSFRNRRENKKETEQNNCG